MRRWIISWTTLLVGATVCAAAHDYFEMPYGQTLPESNAQVGLWWASSGWKIAQDRGLPEAAGDAIVIKAARNEAEAAQLVVRPTTALSDLRITAGALSGADGGKVPAGSVEILQVRYVEVTKPTDRSAVAGPWPDPLPPLTGAIDLAADRNHPFWVRVKVPRKTPAGTYEGRISLKAQGYTANVTLKLEVYDFALPERMTCTSAFGFNPGNVFRYHGLTSERDKRDVLEKYWANLSAHHISPYNPAPFDSINVTWPDIKPPKRKWRGGREVDNEKYAGKRALLIFDDRSDENVEVVYEPLVEIPKAGVRLQFRYRTAIPNQVFLVTFNHHDAAGKWISGGNNDMGIEGTGHWQEFDRKITSFPPGAKSLQLRLRATAWTETGEHTGLVWFDNVSLTDAETGAELIEGGTFEPPTLPDVEREKLRVTFDFAAWDKAMEQAIDRHYFNTFRLGIPGMGGGTFHARHEPQLLGFGEETPHYQALFTNYCTQMQAHLREKGWLDEAFVYWFDEPAPKDYAFVNNGFARLKAAAPDIQRMLTEQVEPGLIGGPNIWCPVSSQYEHEAAEQRRAHGEKFWWYVCTGPKAPFCTLFIDHPGTEMRIWLWQTWQRKIVGILVWQSNYWTSPTAYPDHPQNPYEDPMGWRTGYSTPKGEKRPWGNGDGRFIYPPLAAADANPSEPVLDGPVDSIRWEMLRDGIEDYEYFVILRDLLKTKGRQLDESQRRAYTALLEIPEEITSDMTTFTKDPKALEEHRDRVARAIGRLSGLK